ncbi:MAG TPA: Gfo/Idh/MocA family oxidoreductase [Chthonomonadales bacterium]|nr:Gfo/Idh/MocA family oxidoreductase [Chthonomonadales bacterium]
MPNTSAGKIRIGIIGPSWWVDYWHLPALQRHSRAEICAICGQTERSREQLGERYGERARWFTDWEEMLTVAAPDGVIVCTPNDLHYPATMAALRRNAHVVCEKPLALNARQAREMANEAKSRRLIGMTNFPYRDNPAIQMFRTLSIDGFAGKPLHLTAHYYGGFGLHRPPGWRGSRARSGSGILGDLGSHLIDLVRFVTGREFVTVCAQSLTLLPHEHGPSPDLAPTNGPLVEDRNDDSCAFLAELEGGVNAVLHTSWIALQGAAVQSQMIELYGTLGRLRFEATHAGTRLLGMEAEEARWRELPVAGIAPSGDTFRGEDEDYFRPGRHTAANTTYRWIEAICAGAPAISPDLNDGLLAQEVIDAVEKSSRERRWAPVANSKPSA